MSYKVKKCEVSFLFQGGGALAAYQAGVYEAFAAHGIEPTWLCGISMGAVNCALIAGNPPDLRLQKLKEFWREMTQNMVPNSLGEMGDQSRSAFNQLSSQKVLWGGVPHFFESRPFWPFFYPPGTFEAISFYDTRLFRETLLKYVDFDLINHPSSLRLSVGAVDIERGEAVCFDTRTHTIKPEHIMASGALPPAFPPIKIDNRYYWDGGIVSNTPLAWVLSYKCNEAEQTKDMLIVQVDLWSRSGLLPRTIYDVLTRQKEIQYSSRTHIMTEAFKGMKRLHSLLDILSHYIPAEKLEPLKEEIREILPSRGNYNLLHLTYRSRNYELHSKDYNFSDLSIQERWTHGYEDAQVALRHQEIFSFPSEAQSLTIYDYQKDGSLN